MGLLVGLTAPAAGGELDQTFPAAASGTLTIALDLGSIDIRHHASDEIRIEATAHGVGASSIHFAARVEGDDVVFEGLAEPWVEWLRSAPSVRVRASVPTGYRVHVVPRDRVDLVGSVADESSRIRLARPSSSR